jgi:hypothetical protein
MLEIRPVESPLVSWLKEKLAGKQIPFALFNFYPADQNDWSEYKAEDINGLTLPVLSELTQSERIILDTIENNSVTSTLKLQATLRELAKGLGEYWSDVIAEITGLLDEEAQAIATGEKPKSGSKVLTEKRKALEGLEKLKPVQLSQYIFASQTIEYEMVSATIAYQTFQSESLEQIGAVITLSNEMQDKSFTDLVKVGFFLGSRIGSEWLEPQRLSRLTESKVKAVNDFILREANGGEPVEAVEAPTEEVEPGK